MQLKQGTLLQRGKYKIEKCLGQGSFGITYLAKMKSIISGGKGQTSMWVDVAIKEFFMKDFNSRQPDGSLNATSPNTIVEKYKKDFKREANNLSKMNHPGVVDILDTFEENNTCYLVMAYIDGESLDACISRNGAIPEKEALMYFEQIADALHYMHSQHMLHLDLKPRNIMLDAERNSFVIDFGLSKQYDDNDEPESSTTLGQGTQGYAPLEQGAPHSGHDFPVTIDVYALGATLYKMLTAQTPPHAAVLLSAPEIVKNALATKGVSKNTMSIILKAMSPRKEDRYKNVAGFMKAFGWTAKDYPQEAIMAEVVEITVKNNTNVEYGQSNEENANDVFEQNTSPKNDRKLKIVGLSLLFILLSLSTLYTIIRCENKTDDVTINNDTVCVDSIDTVGGIVTSQYLSPHANQLAVPPNKNDNKSDVEPSQSLSIPPSEPQARVSNEKSETNNKCGYCLGSGICPDCKGERYHYDEPCALCNGQSTCIFCEGTGINHSDK